MTCPASTFARSLRLAGEFRLDPGKQDVTPAPWVTSTCIRAQRGEVADALVALVLCDMDDDGIETDAWAADEGPGAGAPIPASAAWREGDNPGRRRFFALGDL